MYTSLLAEMKTEFESWAAWTFINMQDTDALERNPWGSDYSGETSVSRLLGKFKKVSVAVQGSVCYKVLRSVVEVTNRNQT